MTSFIVLVSIAAGHDAARELANIEAYFTAYQHAFEALLPGVWRVQAPAATTAQAVGQGVAGSCLNQPDQIFVTEVGPNTYVA